MPPGQGLCPDSTALPVSTGPGTELGCVGGLSPPLPLGNPPANPTFPLAHIHVLSPNSPMPHVRAPVHFLGSLSSASDRTHVVKDLHYNFIFKFQNYDISSLMGAKLILKR